MPGVRTAGQVMIGVWVTEQFAEAIDQKRSGKTRSQFCRDSMREKLQRMGIAVTEEQTSPPDRAGKGGAKKSIVRYPENKGTTNAHILNTSSLGSEVTSEIVSDGLSASGKKASYRRRQSGS